MIVLIACARPELEVRPNGSHRTDAGGTKPTGVASRVILALTDAGRAGD